MVVVYPEPFLEIRVQNLYEPIPITGLCAGYEGGQWRSAGLADHLFQWLPFVALNQEHQLSFAAHNFMEMLKLAAAHIYMTRKTKTRGELGELLLHLACILHFNTYPVICKLILKSTSNDTVKGFDGIHVLMNSDKFEIWLGESKFYLDGRQAITEAVTSVKNHILPHFLKTEKAMVLGHIGPDVPNRNQVLKLFKSQTSGDELLKVSTFPILIAYESDAVASFTKLCDEYVETLSSEIVSLSDHFSDKLGDIVLRFQLIFVPMGKKADVVDHFDELLEGYL